MAIIIKCDNNNATVDSVCPADASIQFYTADNRPSSLYVSGLTVLEEVLDHGRLARAYWSAPGQVRRENDVATEPKLDSLRRPLHVFELEIHGQALHNRWEQTESSRRPGGRPGVMEAVVTLKRQLRPVAVNVVTRLDGTAFLARYLEITNTGTVPAALSHVASCAGVLWETNPTQFTPESITEVNPAFEESKRGKFTLGYFASENVGFEGDFISQPLPRETFRSSGRPWVAAPTAGPTCGTLAKVAAVTPQAVQDIAYRAVPDMIAELSGELQRRREAPAALSAAIFLIVLGLQRYRVLRQADNNFRFSADSGDAQPDTAAQFAQLLSDGPPVGIHVLAWVDTLLSLERTLERRLMREFDHRVLFQMSAADSSNLIDSPAANRLGPFRALAYSEEQGTLEKFRPYALPDSAFIAQAQAYLAARCRA